MKPHRLKSLYGYTKMFVGHGFSRDPLCVFQFGFSR